MAEKKVSFGLGCGIFFLPMVFSWFTLREGYSKLARTISFVWFGLILVAMLIPEKPNNNFEPRKVSQKTVIPISEKPSQKIEKPKIKKQKIYRIGERIELGGFAYTIQKVEATSVIKHMIGNFMAGNNAIFYLVYYKIENIQQKTDVVMVDDLKLLDEKGRQFSPSADAATHLVMTGKQELVLSQLQPGISKNTVTAFEVPEDAVSPDGPTLVIPEKGLLSTGKAVVVMPPVELCPKKRGKKRGKKFSTTGC
jgi:hypothetical protein